MDSFSSRGVNGVFFLRTSQNSVVPQSVVPPFRVLPQGAPPKQILVFDSLPLFRSNPLGRALTRVGILTLPSWLFHFDPPFSECFFFHVWAFVVPPKCPGKNPLESILFFWVLGNLFSQTRGAGPLVSTGGTIFSGNASFFRLTLIHLPLFNSCFFGSQRVFPQAFGVHSGRFPPPFPLRLYQLPLFWAGPIFSPLLSTSPAGALLFFPSVGGRNHFFSPSSRLFLFSFSQEVIGVLGRNVLAFSFPPCQAWVFYSFTKQKNTPPPNLSSFFLLSFYQGDTPLVFDLPPPSSCFWGLEPSFCFKKIFGFFFFGPGFPLFFPESAPGWLPFTPIVLARHEKLPSLLLKGFGFFQQPPEKTRGGVSGTFYGPPLSPGVEFLKRFAPFLRFLPLPSPPSGGGKTFFSAVKQDPQILDSFFSLIIFFPKFFGAGRGHGVLLPPPNPLTPQKPPKPFLRFFWGGFVPFPQPRGNHNFPHYPGLLPVFSFIRDLFLPTGPFPPKRVRSFFFFLFFFSRPHPHPLSTWMTAVGEAF